MTQTSQTFWCRTRESDGKPEFDEESLTEQDAILAAEGSFISAILEDGAVDGHVYTRYIDLVHYKYDDQGNPVVLDTKEAKVYYEPTRGQWGEF